MCDKSLAVHQVGSWHVLHLPAMKRSVAKGMGTDTSVVGPYLTQLQKIRLSV